MTALVSKILMLGAGLSMIAAFLSVVMAIAARELHWDFVGLDAYAGYAIASALFLALPGTLLRGEHIRVTLILQKVSPKVARWMERWCLLAAIALSGLLTWFAIRLVMVSYTTHDISQGADATPLWIPQLSMALGCAGLLIGFIEALVCHFTGRTFWVSSETARSE